MLKVVLLASTPGPEDIVARAGKLCYSEKGIEEIAIPDKDRSRMVSKLFRLGHHSTLEHASFTFGIEGISRACSHQLVRHRMASFSQQSQRYVKFSRQFEYYTPDSIQENPEAFSIYQDTMESLSHQYAKLIEMGIPAEDARYLLPNSCTTKIIMTMNARELLHFFNLRLCSRAQKEIRDLAKEMMKLVKNRAPDIFGKSGPTCVSYDYCMEEAKDCPLYEPMKKRQQNREKQKQQS